jgi:hypothetical protein
MSYKAYLKTGEQKAIKNREELRKAKGLPPDGIVPVATKVTDANVQTDFVGGVKHFNALVLEVHSIFAHLKTLVDEIKALDIATPPPPAAAPAPAAAAAAGALASTDERQMLHVRTALGKWNTIDIKKSIEVLVKFEDDVTRLIGITDHPQALLKLVALIALEFGAKAALPDATKDDTAALLKKIQETEKQLKANKVILDEYAATKTELQGLMYPHANKWSDVIPTIKALKDNALGIDTHTPELYKQNGKLQLEEWRKEFDDRQAKIEAYAATQLRVQKIVYDLKTWDKVEETLTKLIIMNDEVNKNVPEAFNVNKTVSLQGWKKDYDCLVSLRDAMWDSFTTDFKDKIKIGDVQWAHQFKLTVGAMGVYRDNEEKLLELMKVPGKEVLPTITALMTLRTDTFAAIPEPFKKDRKIEECTECVGHWSAEWTELVGFRHHVHAGLWFTDPQDNPTILRRFDGWVKTMTTLHGMDADLTCHDCPKILQDILKLVHPVQLSGIVAQITTWKTETTRLAKVITDNEVAAKAVADAAVGGEGAAKAAAEAARIENVRLTSELGAVQASAVETDDLLKAAQVKLGASEDLGRSAQERVRLSEEARGLVQVLLDAKEEEVRELTAHITHTGEGRTSAPRADVADRVSELLVELNYLMPGRLTDRVPQDVIVKMASQIVAAFTGCELKDVITRLVSQLESAVHPGVRVESMRDMLAELEKAAGEREEMREPPSAEEGIARSRRRAL